MDLAEADAAKAAVVEMERKVAAGEPVGTDERATTHARYTAAEQWRSEQEAQARRDAQAAAGIVPGPTQSIIVGS